VAIVSRKPTRPTTVNGRNVFITGAASGIGAATARAAGRAGARLFLTDINAESLAAVADELRADGAAVELAAAADVADYDAVARLAREIHEKFGPMSIVMNIAGVSAWGTVENLTHRQWRKMVDVNLMGPIHVIEEFLPPMIDAGRGGHLVNVSSAAGLVALPWHGAYSASKYGLRGLSEVLRFDLRRHGIGVSVVVPGAVRTPLVGTVEIAGVDRDDPRVRRAVGLFERHAVSPETVAQRILAGIQKNRFLVYTSADVRVGYWFKRKFALPYELVLRLANGVFTQMLPPDQRRRARERR
jgi:NAD(P)-dependent dehydrogenase (short-subunit alcohol dehydrogenase family)